MKKQTSVVLCSLILIGFYANAQKNGLKYILPDAVLTAKDICGEKICIPEGVGMPFHYTKKPYSPDITLGSAISAQDIALQVLGRTIPTDDIESQDYNTCSNTSQNPFTVSDLAHKGNITGREINYKKSETLSLSIDAAVDANMKELMKLTSDQNVLANMKISIKAAYTHINGQDLTVNGVYSEFSLNQTAMDKIKKGNEYQACRTELQKNQRIILGVGLVYFDIKFTQNSVDSISSQIDADLAKQGVKGSLSVSFKREITKTLKASSIGLYQILIITHAGLENDRFVYDLPKK